MKTLIIKIVLLCLISIPAYTQNKVKTFSFKKGEVLDILLLSTTKENTKALFDRYKETAFPVAFKYSYQPQPGFAIKKLVLGNYLPTSFILGKWESKAKREGFLQNIVKNVPDFHQQRRDLFTNFELTYYEMPRDISFSVASEKYTVATAFWGNSKKNKELYKKWEAKTKERGGGIVIKLENGISPAGYYYNADVLYIVQWKNAKEFESFAKKYPLPVFDKLQNVHQFVIQ